MPTLQQYEEARNLYAKLPLSFLLRQLEDEHNVTFDCILDQFHKMATKATKGAPGSLMVTVLTVLLQSVIYQEAERCGLKNRWLEEKATQLMEEA